MELRKLTDRIWYSMYEEERDRPCLGYIKGDHWSLAVDAGHSAAHVDEFYEALRSAGLPLPAVTVLTHWHWDHAFGVHRINGLSVANKRTNRHLSEFADRIETEGPERFFDLDQSIRREYSNGEPVIVLPADIVFDEDLWLDLGNVAVRLITSVSPHTDDSTIVCVPGEKTAFLGDCISGEFPSWERDRKKTLLLIETLKMIDADRLIGGHWDVFSKRELISALEEAVSTELHQH